MTLENAVIVIFAT